MGGTVYVPAIIKDCNNVSDKRLHMKGTSNKHFLGSIALTHFVFLCFFFPIFFYFLRTDVFTNICPILNTKTAS